MDGSRKWELETAAACSVHRFQILGGPRTMNGPPSIPCLLGHPLLTFANSMTNVLGTFRYCAWRAGYYLVTASAPQVSEAG